MQEEKTSLSIKELGRMGGLARAKKLSKERRREIGAMGGRKGGAARTRNLSKERLVEIARMGGTAKRNRPRAPSQKRCAQCGKSFMGQTSRRFCSDEHRDAAREKRLKSA